MSKEMSELTHPKVRDKKPMDEMLIDLINKQSDKLDEHLAHIRQSMHDTNNNLQGVIGTVQMTRKDMSHNNEMNTAHLEMLKCSITRIEIDLGKTHEDLKHELDNLDVEVAKLKEARTVEKSKVDTVYRAYSIMEKALIGLVVAGVLYAVVLAAKIKGG